MAKADSKLPIWRRCLLVAAGELLISTCRPAVQQMHHKAGFGVLKRDDAVWRGSSLIVHIEFLILGHLRPRRPFCRLGGRTYGAAVAGYFATV